jgi:hypothetical protein
VFLVEGMGCVELFISANIVGGELLADIVRYWLRQCLHNILHFRMLLSKNSINQSLSHKRKLYIRSVKVRLVKPDVVRTQKRKPNFISAP